jgi:hypothetical protein
VRGVLFLPDLFYDHRIWADLPASLGANCDVVRAIADVAPDGRFIATTADTDLVWLEDGIQAKAAVTDVLGGCPFSTAGLLELHPRH